MSVKETYEWAKEKMSSWKDLAKESSSIPNEANKQIAARPLWAFENPSFRGDITVSDNDLLFHFFPTDNPKYNIEVTSDAGREWVFSASFEDAMDEAFLKVFKFTDRLFSDYVRELRSWVVRCAGYGKNPFLENLAEEVLIILKEKYET